MSYSIINSKEAYINLLEGFDKYALNAEEFIRAFLTQVRLDQEKDREIFKHWDKPYDIILIDELQDGKITKEKFRSAWEELWRYSSTDSFLKIFENIFRDIEDFEPDQNIRSLDHSYIGENDLRQKISYYLARIRCAEERSP